MLKSMNLYIKKVIKKIVKTQARRRKTRLCRFTNINVKLAIFTSLVASAIFATTGTQVRTFFYVYFVDFDSILLNVFKFN